MIRLRKEIDFKRWTQGDDISRIIEISVFGYFMAIWIRPALKFRFYGRISAKNGK